MAHRYARTDPPGLFGKSMLAEVQALPRVLDPAGLLWWEYVFRYTLRSRIFHCLPSLALTEPAAFSEAEVWTLFHCGFHHPGDPANPTFMMRKTDRENNRLLANRHRQE